MDINDEDLSAIMAQSLPVAKRVKVDTVVAPGILVPPPDLPMYTPTQEDNMELTRIGLDSFIAGNHRELHVPFTNAVLGRVYSEDPTPEGMTVNLRTHQRMLVRALRDREEQSTTFSVIDLADASRALTMRDMRTTILAEQIGSGKSNIILSRIMQAPTLQRQRLRVKHMLNEADTMHWDSWFEITASQELVGGSTSMIVFPHGLVVEWTRFLKQTPLSYTLFNSRAALAGAQTDTSAVWLVTSTMYCDLISQVLNKQFARIVFDEFDTVNFTTRNISIPEAASLVLVSSNVSNIFKGVAKTLTFRNMLIQRASSIDNFLIKAPYQVVSEAINARLGDQRRLVVRAPVMLRVLTNVISPEIMVMMNAGDVEGACRKLGLEVFPTLDAMVHSLLIQSEAKVAELHVKLDEVQHTVSMVRKYQDKIDRAQRRVRFFQSKIADLAKDEPVCAVCYDLPTNPLITRCCLNKWCAPCITTWARSRGTCPICRTSLTPAELCQESNQVNINSGGILPTESTQFDSKEAALQNLFNYMKRTKRPRRIIIFSEFSESYSTILDVCTTNGVECKTLAGTGASVGKRIGVWEKTSVMSAIFLNARTYGTGLNLQAATDIILWHSISSGDLHRQVIGRVVRMGMVVPPTLWRITFDNEIQHA